MTALEVLPREHSQMRGKRTQLKKQYAQQSRNISSYLNHYYDLIPIIPSPLFLAIYETIQTTIDLENLNHLTFK